ncbi:WGxxGxxG family protein [Actinomadura kijaniata]|uniref:WGxxGxxG family protein n=1 Tax=Actinomadura kijaniata TaxID=46161 RepID=UPI0009FF76FB|nr:WGxxGxxG family protein [Actinomadura kijaniata]
MSKYIAAAAMAAFISIGSAAPALAEPTETITKNQVQVVASQERQQPRQDNDDHDNRGLWGLTGLLGLLGLLGLARKQRETPRREHTVPPDRR